MTSQASAAIVVAATVAVVAIAGALAIKLHNQR
jgi:hypothetical protein